MRLGLTALGVYDYVYDYVYDISIIFKSDSSSFYTYIHRKFYFCLVNMGILIMSFKLIRETKSAITFYLNKQVEIVRKIIPKVTNNRVGIHNVNLTILLNEYICT